MTDRPILFSAPMIRAILREIEAPGTGKTQTRRVLKLGSRRPDYIGPRGCTEDPSCWGWSDDERGDYWLVKRGEGDKGVLDWSDWSGAYQTGDRLWARETWTARMTHGWTIADARSRMCQEEILYKADGRDSIDGWWPSIHMPREFSRLTLHVNDVRVQRLQDIGEADARAEGLIAEPADGPGGLPATSWHWLAGQEAEKQFSSARSAFRALWDSLNASRAPWASNPWVVAVTFRPVLSNIDRKDAA